MSGWSDLQLLSRLGIVFTVPVILAAGPLLGDVLGAWVDRRWQTAPWGMAIGVTFGLIGSGVQLYHIYQWLVTQERNKTGKS